MLQESVHSHNHYSNHGGKFDPKSKEALSSFTILLVEDGVDNQQVIEHFLCSRGARVVLAENGQLGVDRALQDPTVDLVLMDVQMPVMGGFEATSILRSHGFKKPIIALTAAALNGEKERCLLAGFDGYMTKPFLVEDLIHGLRNQLHRYAVEHRMVEASPGHEGPREPSHSLRRSKLLDDPSFKTIVEGFVERLPLRFKTLRETLVHRQDFEEAVRLCHQLKGACGSYGYKELAEIVAHFESDLKNGMRGEVSDYLEEIGEEIKLIQKGLLPS